MKKLFTIAMLFAALAGSFTMTSCSNDDDESGVEQSAGSFSINGTKYAFAEAPVYSYYGGDEGSLATYESATIYALKNMDGYAFSFDIIVGQGQTLKKGEVLTGDDTEWGKTYISMTHFYSYTNLSGYNNNVNYVSGNVTVESVSAESLKLKFNNFKLSVAKGTDKGEHTLSGTINLSQK